MEFVRGTDVGRKRKQNEDSYSILTLVRKRKTLRRTLILKTGEEPEREHTKQLSRDHDLQHRLLTREPGFDTFTVLTVADGMGGHKAGEVASAHVAEHFPHHVIEKFMLTPSDLTIALISAVLLTNKGVLSLSRLGGGSKENMGTTLTSATIIDDRAYVVNAGDSRTYLFRDGLLRRITSDHSFVQALIDVGAISEEEARTHPNKNVITNHIGKEKPAEPDTYTETLMNGDILLLCSDGLTDMLEDGEIQDIIVRAPFEGAADVLIHEANEKGGKDNITVVLGRYSLSR